MRSKRSLLGVVGILVWMLFAVLSTGPAQAAPAPDHDRTARATAAVSPTISPAAHFIHRADDELFDCTSGNLCVQVWDYTVSKWKVFFLYECKRYSLSNWTGSGYYLNKQTGDVTSYFYDQSGQVLRAFTPPQVGTQDWTPVWSIRNC